MLCPICDEPLETTGSWYGGYRCSNGHFEEECGNYHKDVIINGRVVAHFDDWDNSREVAKLEEAIKSARRWWEERNLI